MRFNPPFRSRILVAILLTFTAARVPAEPPTPGTLDLIFQKNASAVLRPGEFSYPPVMSVARDGTILFAGDIIDGSAVLRQYSTLFRLRADGALDASFHPPSLEYRSVNDAGILETNLGYASQAIEAGSGRILVKGVFTHVNGFARTNWVRLNADGSADPTFSLSTNLNLTRLGPVLLVQADGSVILAEEQPPLDIGNPAVPISAKLRRLHPDGALDPAFQTDLIGRGIDIFAGGRWERIAADGVQQAGGSLLITGSFTNINSHPAEGIARLNSVGGVDLSFQREDKVHNNDYFGAGSFHAIQPDEKILLLDATFGDCPTVQEYCGGDALPMVRLSRDGSMDQTFHPALPPDLDSTSLHGIAVQADSRLLVSGPTTTSTTTNFAGAIYRLNPDGSLDPSFRALYLGGGLDAMRLEANGQILISGSFTNVNGVTVSGVARLNSGFNPPVFIRFNRSSETAVATIASLPGTTYRFDYSGDLVHWWPVATNTATQATLPFEHRVDSAARAVFYRSIALPNVPGTIGP
jgi:uncharacterized delta-60 repeat protein